jgi:hypothetical protein
MSFFTWGPAKTSDDDGWERTRVRVDKVRYGHSPDKRGERTDRYGKEPIWVRNGKVIDGNDRVHYARERGDTWIEAWVKR